MFTINYSQLMSILWGYVNVLLHYVRHEIYTICLKRDVRQRLFHLHQLT